MKDEAVFFDIDDTIIDGALAQHIGIAAYKEAEGIEKAYAFIKAIQVKTQSYVSESLAMKSLARSFGKVGLTKDDIERHSKNSITRKIKPGVEDFLKEVSEYTNVVLLTTGFDVGPDTLESQLDLNIAGKISNEIVYNKDDQVHSANIMYTNKNIVKKVAEVAHERKKVYIIDDRPERYDKLHEFNGHCDISVYSSIADFKKLDPIS